MPKASKTCPKSNKSPNLVTLLTGKHFSYSRTESNELLFLSILIKFSQTSIPGKLSIMLVLWIWFDRGLVWPLELRIHRISIHCMWKKKKRQKTFEIDTLMDRTSEIDTLIDRTSEIEIGWVFGLTGLFKSIIVLLIIWISKYGDSVDRKNCI